MNYDRTNSVRKALLFIFLAALLGLAGCFKTGPEPIQSPISIAISASTGGSIAIGQAVTITALVYDQNEQGVQWSALPLNFGTLSNSTYDPSTLTATITYTAPTIVASPTKVTITATSITNPNISASLSFPFNPITIALLNENIGTPMAPLTLNPNDQLPLFAIVSNDISNLGASYSISPATGVGSISVSSGFATYTAPVSVSAPTTVTVTAASVKEPTVTTSQQITILPSCGPTPSTMQCVAGPNVIALNVNGGPVPGQVIPNRAFTSILLCNPGTTTCQTVEGILVDTGSYGLRILQSAIPLLTLPAVTDPLGNTVENCASWPDGSFLWGPASRADLYIGGEYVSSLLGAIPPVIQVISSTVTVVPDGCSNGAAASDNTPELLGANGILGIGPEPTDCTLSGVNYCDGSIQSPPPNIYYACPSIGCGTGDSPVLINASLQVSNPVAAFVTSSADYNGVIIQVPPVADPQSSTIGTISFGIGTESNNSLGNATVLTLNNSDNFATEFNAQILTNSFIDSGSSGLFFPDALPSCVVNSQFYCPTSPVILSATNVGQTQGQSTVNFTVEDADSLLFAFSQDSVFPTLAGPSQSHGSCILPGSTSCVFDWGLPFFYGRTVYIAIDGTTVFNAPAPPPWVAY